MCVCFGYPFVVRVISKPLCGYSIKKTFYCITHLKYIMYCAYFCCIQLLLFIVCLCTGAWINIYFIHFIVLHFVIIDYKHQTPLNTQNKITLKIKIKIIYFIISTFTIILLSEKSHNYFHIHDMDEGLPVRKVVTKTLLCWERVYHPYSFTWSKRDKNNRQTYGVTRED